MAFVVDAARDADATVARALTGYLGTTPRYPDDYLGEAVFTIKQSVVETVVPGLNVAVAPVDNTADAAAPIIDFTLFWNDKTAATVRPA